MLSENCRKVLIEEIRRALISSICFSFAEQYIIIVVLIAFRVRKERRSEIFTRKFAFGNYQQVISKKHQTVPLGNCFTTSKVSFRQK